MAVVVGDIVFRYSKFNGSGNNFTQASTAADSYGNRMSTTAVTAASLNNLFSDISAADNDNTKFFYKCIFIHNTNVTDTLSTITVLASETTTVGGSAEIDYAFDNLTSSTAVFDYNTAAAAIARTAAGVNTEPPGSMTWTDIGTALPQTITLAPNKVKGIWIRVQGNNTNASAETITLSWSGTA